MNRSSANVLLNGSWLAAPEWIPLRAGPLRLHFDPESLSLRQFRVGEKEVLRSIYAAVRDRNWGTIEPRVSNLEVSVGPNGFHIQFDAACHQGDVDFAWRGTLTGDASGTVRFAFVGEARSTFWRNRIGLCVLHPLAECCGAECRVEHADGKEESSAFPQSVSPHQPFLNLRALTHAVVPGLQAEVRFSGEIFETEDHRNWTDGSFKTYGTPLELPFPVRVEKGTQIHQEVCLRLHGAPPSASQEATAATSVTVLRERALPMPAIGLAIASHGQELSARQRQRLKSLRLAHLRADLWFEQPNWPESLRRASLEAAELGVGLHLALHLTNENARDLDQLLRQLADFQPPVLLWLVYAAGQNTTPNECLRLAQNKLTEFGAGIPFAAGTDANFAELNRHRPAPGSTAYPCYSMNPQVHAFDGASMVENLGGQVDPVETAWSFSQRPIVVSPITLRPGFNPNATVAEANDRAGELPASVDRRQLSLLGAAWTLGSIAQLIRTGHVHSLTYYETTGWQGVLETEAGSPMPEQFPSIAGGVFPMFHVFADFAGAKECYAVRCSDPLAVTGAALLMADGSLRVLIGNLLRRPQVVRVQIAGSAARLRLLDASNVERAMREPEAFRSSSGTLMKRTGGGLDLPLEAYALACLDCAITAQAS